MTQLAGIEKIMLLQSADIFAYCRAEEILRIAGIAKERQVETGERIYEANGPAEALYCVVRGSVSLDGSRGTERSVGALGTFGVEEILSGRLRGGGATATEDTLVLQIDAEDFFDLLSNNIEIVKALFRHIIDRHEAEAARSSV